jgi:hypothetical protein
VAELREEVIRARATAVMAGARATWADKRRKGPTSACREADEAARKASLLEGELMAARSDRDTTEAKFLSLVDTATSTE